MREKLFEVLDGYKHVVSPGSYLNNVNDSKKRCSWKEKHEYLKTSKFTIAGDSIEYPGFVTEKIVDPFKHHSVPIYFGSTKIDEDFNTDAFVWCKSKDDIDRTLEQIKYLDTHDDAYLEMLMCNPLHSEDYLVKIYEQLESFLVNIFSQERDEAYRRVKYFCAHGHEQCLKEYAKRYERIPGFVKYLRTLKK